MGGSVVPQPRQQLSEVLTFHPEWWTDPVPPWVFIRDLDRAIQVQLIAVQLEVQAQMLEQRAGAARKTMEILQQVK
jgi:hypothetical protein